MNISALKTVGTRFLAKNSVRLGKHAPVILTTVGIVGVVTSAVLAARATLKLEATVDATNTERADVNELYEAGEIDQHRLKKELTKVYFRGAGRIVKLYGPSVGLGVFSIGCIVGGHGVLSKRNVALVAAYKGLESTYNGYRSRVIEEFGEEKDYEIRRKVATDVVQDIEIDENGEEKLVRKATHDISQYARFFDENNPNWRGADNNINLLFLKSVQNYANDLLYTRGHVMLNEVYERLGFEHTSAGALVGWMIEPGDMNEIDFGIFNKNSDAARDFVNGYEKSILLDFNVDGLIYDKI